MLFVESLIMEFVPASFESFKVVGAGLAAISLVGAGAGVGIVFHALISSFGRNPDLRGPLLQLTILRYSDFVFLASDSPSFNFRELRALTYENARALHRANCPRATGNR